MTQRAGRASTRKRPTDEQLLDAAVEVIAEVGVRGATMDKIAEQAGTTRVTLYNHFQSREALVKQALDREVDAFTDWMFAGYDRSEDMPYGARARYSVRLLFDYARQRPAGFRVTIGHLDRDETAGRRVYRVLEPRIAARLRRNYAERGATIASGADTLASLLLMISLDVAHRALFIDGSDIDAACDLATTATIAVLQAIRPEQLQAIEESLPPT